jgi:hypothetical protein
MSQFASLENATGLARRHDGDENGTGRSSEFRRLVRVKLAERGLAGRGTVLAVPPGAMKRSLIVWFVLGCSAASRGTPMPDGEAELSCVSLSEADCAHTSSCHPVFTSDQACDSLCCPSHFAGCSDGASANCDERRTAVCSGSCAMADSTCIGALAQAYTADGCCPDGCVVLSECAGVTVAPSNQCASGREDTLHLPAGERTACDPGDLSAFGPQGCPPQ